MKQSEPQLARTLVELVQSPCLVTDSHGVVLASTHTTPWRAPDGPPIERIHDAFAADEGGAVERFLEGAEEEQCARGLRGADGEVRPWRIVRICVPPSFLYLWIDVDAKQQLVEVEKTCTFQGSVLSSLGHEFRNPLHAILGSISCLVDQVYGELNESQAECVRDAHEAAKHLLWLSRQLLDVTKIESGGQRLELAPVDSHDLIETAVRLERDAAVRKKIELVVDEPQEVLPALFADGRRLTQVLVNLIGNAVKYTPEGGKVVVGVRPSGADALFFVSDTGIGIDESDHERIFEPFERVGGAEARKIEGSGLGLALAKRIVEKHGGQIAVRSAQGEGSTFAFRVPFVGEDGDHGGADEHSGAAPFDWRVIFQ